MLDCAAVSWNSPTSKWKDGNCNFKCSTAGRKYATGEQGVIVRPGKDLCGPLMEDELCAPGEMPPEWLPRCRAGQLLVSPSLRGGLMPEVGNGYIATVVQSDTIYAAGLFNGDATGKVHGWATRRARIPPYTTKIVSKGATGWRALDMERAVFLQRSTLPTGVRVEERWYAPSHVPTLLVHEIELVNPGESAAAVEFHAAPEHDSEDLELLPKEEPDLFVVTGANKLPEAGNKTRVALAANTLPDNCQLPAKGKFTLYALTAVVTSLNSKDPLADARAAVREYMANGYARARMLLAEHSAAWVERLEAGRLEVVGDLKLARALNASLYFLRSSIRPDWPLGLSPGGLASNGYSGHTFWDQETWMWPPLLMLDPGCAVSALQYRVDRQAGAAAEAAACGTPDHHECTPGYLQRRPAGALMFPWESALSGQEVQYWHGAIGNWGRYEQHISGDIAFAVRQFWYTTRDRQWLAEKGFPLVKGVAAFYAARLDERPGTAGVYDYNSVMGPDEYACPVNNSAYTLAIVNITLRFAVEAARELGYPEAEYQDFAVKAAGLRMPFSYTVPTRPDLQGGYIPEYTGFPKNPAKPTVKQADTVLLSFPLGVELDPVVAANGLAFYDNITDATGPAMTWSMFAIGWMNVGDFVRSQRHFRHGYANAQEPFNVWTETPTGGTVNFITGAGGFLQSVLFGTSGMRIRHDGLHFDPPPPSSTGSRATRLVVHSFHYLGSRLRQEVTADGATYELLGVTRADAPRLAVVSSCQPVQALVVGRLVALPRGPAVIQPLAEVQEQRPRLFGAWAWAVCAALLLLGVVALAWLRGSLGRPGGEVCLHDESSGGDAESDEY